MRYSTQSKLATINYHLSDGLKDLNVFIATNKNELNNLGLYENLNNQLLAIEQAIKNLDEVF